MAGEEREISIGGAKAGTTGVIRPVRVGENYLRRHHVAQARGIFRDELRRHSREVMLRQAFMSARTTGELSPSIHQVACRTSCSRAADAANKDVRHLLFAAY
jgi:hypothetical protein